MPRILTQDLIPGMITDEDVFSYNNQLIIPRDLELTDKSITKLELYSILSVRVKDQVAEIDDIDSITEENISYAQKVKASREYKVFKETFDKTITSLQGTVSDLLINHHFDKASFMQAPKNLLSGNPSGIHIFDMLHNMRMYDDPTYAHCLNVSLICNVFGRWLDFSEEDVEQLTLAGLLHDIGKIKIPADIIQKPDKLSTEEFQIVKTHTIEGYNLVKDLDIDDRIKNAILMHHEKCDGSGYPLGLKSDKIDSFAKIVSIADVYDAMTSARVYRGPMCPFTVLSIFESEGYQKYDSSYILTFLEYVVNTYLNNRVRLSNGMEGTIVLINKLDLSHPMIHCDGSYIDLSHERGVSIEEII